MFVDFDKVFNDKSQPQVQIPDAFIAYLNKQLPDGLKYTVDTEGNCTITSDDTSFTLGGFVFTISPDDKKVLGKDYTRDDILQLYYNRQQPIPLQLKKDGYVLLNGEEFPVEKMFVNPHNPIQKKSGKFFMTPHEFPKPFLLSVGCDGYERKLLVSRIPNNSVGTAAFESEKNAPLVINYFITPEKQTLSMSMSFNLSHAKTIRDIVESTRIYNAYLDGKGYLCGHHLETKLHGKNAKRFEETSAEFWEKVLQIEEFLGVTFTPPHEDIDFDTICIVEQLYQNLIKKTPIRETDKPDTLDGVWEAANEKDIMSAIGSAVYFEFEATKCVTLFGSKFTLHGLMGIMDAVLSDVSKKGKKYKIILQNASEERTRFTSSIFFKDEVSMKAYKEEDHNQRIKAFYAAKRAREYWSTK